MLATKQQQQALVELFQKNGSLLRYKKGELIIRHGDTPGGVYYIKSGLVKAYNISRYGEENLLIIRKPDEIFPLIWALKEDEWHVIYETLCEVEVYRISRKIYFDAISKNNDLMPPLLDTTINMYKLHSQRIINLQYRTARERLVSFLLLMADRFGVKTASGILLDVPLRQQDIASSINASRETTSREIALLERKGIIEAKSMHVHILLKDIAQLKSFIK
jgi:CRP-like cAMP-binding protein